MRFLDSSSSIPILGCAVGVFVFVACGGAESTNGAADGGADSPSASTSGGTSSGTNVIDCRPEGSCKDKNMEDACTDGSNSTSTCALVADATCGWVHECPANAAKCFLVATRPTPLSPPMPPKEGKEGAIAPAMKACKDTPDCTIVEITPDCCGSTQVAGVSTANAGTLRACDAIRQATFPACGCAGRTFADDGTMPSDGTTAKVACVAGVCTTTFAP